MQRKRPFAPAVINRIDRYLLLNKPEIWSARTHMVLYYGFLFILLIAGLAFIVPNDPRQDSPAPYWVAFMSIISSVALIGWLIYLLRFNVFKRYGLTSPVNRLVTFILFMVAVGTFILFCYVQPVVESIRANAAYTDDEVIGDINKMNLGINILEYDSLDHEWSVDTVLVTDRITDDEDMDDVVETASVSTITEITRGSLASKLRLEDSVQKLNDSMYVFFSCPSYALLDPYLPRADDSKLLSSLDIYRRLIINYTPQKDKARTRTELAEIQKKYKSQRGYYSSYDGRPDVIERIAERYELQYLRESMDNIMEKKHRWLREDVLAAVRIIFYTSLVLSLLLFSFRHTTAKVFFITVLTAIILTVLTSLVMAFSGTDEEAILNTIIFYFVLALGVSVTAFTIKKRRIVTGVALNLLLWMLPFIPLCMVASYYEALRRHDRFNYSRDYPLEARHFLIAEIAGAVILVVMILTYFHQAYKKWYAAPEN